MRIPDLLEYERVQKRRNAVLSVVKEHKLTKK